MGSSCCSRPIDQNEEIIHTNSNIQQQNSNENIQQDQENVLLQNDDFLNELKDQQKREMETKTKIIKGLSLNSNQNQDQQQKQKQDQDQEQCKESNQYEELQKSDTPEFQTKDQELNQKQSIHQQESSNNIVFVRETTQDIINKQQRRQSKSGDSPIKIFISRNSLKKMTKDLNRLKAIPEINKQNMKYLDVEQSVEEMKNDEENLKRKASKKLSRSFSSVQKEQDEKSGHNGRYNSCDSNGSMKKSILKKELKYSKFKKVRTLSNMDNDNKSQNGSQIGTKKKVRFEKAVLKKQKSKFR